MTKGLEEVLVAIDWNANVKEFLKDETKTKRIESAILRLATWSRQLEEVEKDNPALGFVREMQSSAHSAIGLLAVGFYKPSIAASRTLVETALYFVYFRDHSKELATLVREKDYYLGKEELLEYLRQHSADYKTFEQVFGFNGRLKEWYGTVSAVVHGQIPGVFSPKAGLAGLKFLSAQLEESLRLFLVAEELAHQLFLITVGQQHWASISGAAKKILLHGLAGPVKQQLKLDAA